MSEELQEVIGSNPEWYRDLQYKDVKVFIKDNINSATRSFVAIGYYLKHIRDNEMYREDGYESIWDMAQAEFGFSQSWTSRCMSINDRFSKDGNSPILLEKYKDFDKSKLSEMLSLTDQQIEQVTLTTTVAQIKDIKRTEKSYATSHKELEEVVSTPKQEPEVILSALGKPKKAYQEGSLLSTPGCEEGNSCFCCARDCQIRQEDRYCVDAPMGNPFLCDTMYIDDGLLNDKCMFINLDLAYHRAGDHEPSPCCKECKNQCEYVCKRAKCEVKQESHDEAWFVKCYFDKHPEDLAKLMRICREHKAKGECAKEFQVLKAKYGHSFSSGGGYCFTFMSFTSGVDLEFGKEKIHMKYGRLVEEALKLYNPSDPKYDEKKPNDIPETVNDRPKTVDNEPEILNDVEETVIEEPETEEIMRFDFWEHKPVVMKCSNCNYNSMSPDEFLANSIDEKEEFPCNSCDDKLNHWELKAEEVEIVEADIIQTSPIEDESDEDSDDETLDPEAYTVFDIDTEMTALMKWLEEFRKDDSKAPARRKSKMRWDAICLLDKRVREANVPKDPEPEPQKQPELPVLKNNDQRKEFIEAYETWPIWIDQKETGERYYRYDLSDKVAMVVKVSLRHIYESYKETKKIDFDSEQYYLLGIKSDYSVKSGSIFREDPERTFYECSSNKSALVDYLREFQKKGV